MMSKLKRYARQLLALLNKAGLALSYVWFLIPVGYYYAVKGAWANSESSPQVTDSFLNHIFWLAGFFIVALCYLFRRKSRVQGCLASIVGALMLLALFLTGMMLESAPTSFAAEHPIPEGLAYNLPLPWDADMAAEVNPDDSTTFLQVRNGFQGGIYEYTFFYPGLPAGTLWLECYEVTENLRLSASRVKERTRQDIGSTSHFACLVSNREFTIYEGDWGDCYAARIEVWFEPKKGHKRKLLEKVYGIEGWMR